jgi:hypothetical protein
MILNILIFLCCTQTLSVIFAKVVIARRERAKCAEQIEESLV